jgi:ankyrin repeat protein
MTPLHEAAQRGAAEIVEALLRHGADRHALNKRHRTPIDLAAEHHREKVLEVFRKSDAGA